MKSASDSQDETSTFTKTVKEIETKLNENKFDESALFEQQQVSY
jgi:hypothetical protein